MSNTRRLFARSARWALAGCLTLTSAACGTTRGLSGAAPGVRTLPPVADIVPAPAPRPVPKRGEDARLYARRALDYGDANAAGLGDAANRYGALADAMKHPAPVPEATEP